MDKLEKALEKARTQREGAAPAGGPPPRRSATAAPQSLPPSTVTIDEEMLDENHIIAYQTKSFDADVFRILRTRILQAMAKQNFKTLAITSPNYGDGKTTIALNLAVSIALDLKQTVLLADLDLRKPSIPGYLNIEPKAGLTDHLLDGTPLADCMLRMPFERLSILPAGRKLDKSSEILGSPQMATLAQELHSRYPDRFIIYDMPPILSQDDAIAFLPHVDAVLLVVQNGVTKTSEVRHCLHALEHANVIGTVLNNRT